MSSFLERVVRDNDFAISPRIFRAILGGLNFDRARFRSSSKVALCGFEWGRVETFSTIGKAIRTFSLGPSSSSISQPWWGRESNATIWES